jgi:hypothetical protein
VTILKPWDKEKIITTQNSVSEWNIVEIFSNESILRRFKEIADDIDGNSSYSSRALYTLALLYAKWDAELVKTTKEIADDIDGNSSYSSRALYTLALLLYK